MKLKKSFVVSAPGKAVDVIAELTGLPKLRLKDAMQKGAVLLRSGKKVQRLRRATAALQIGDRVECCYDADILSREPVQPILIADEKLYSVWHKPAGVLAQGNEWGDHCALLRLVELHLNRSVYLVHRLDREAQGLTIIAHSPKAAAKLSELFQTRTMEKWYRVEVKGVLPEQGTWRNPIEGKPAVSHFQRIAVYEQSSVANVRIEHGRKHQIRRHFTHNGFPVLGDPMYGEENHDARGLQLVAYKLAFTCPLTHKARQFTLPDYDDLR